MSISDVLVWMEHFVAVALLIHSAIVRSKNKDLKKIISDLGIQLDQKQQQQVVNNFYFQDAPPRKVVVGGKLEEPNGGKAR